jgi:hypothetical protein
MITSPFLFTSYKIAKKKKKNNKSVIPQSEITTLVLCKVTVQHRVAKYNAKHWKILLELRHQLF